MKSLKTLITLMLVLAFATPAWAFPPTPPGGTATTPGGSSGDVQCNSSGSFAACTSLTDAESIPGPYVTTSALTGVQTITGTLSPARVPAQPGDRVDVVSVGKNTATAPTFNTIPITKGGGQALVAGDIGEAGFVAQLQLNAAGTAWELLNPVYPPGQSPGSDGTYGMIISTNTGAWSTCTGSVMGYGTDTNAPAICDAGTVKRPVDTTSSQSLSGKTLTSPVINGATGTGGKFTGDLTGLSPQKILTIASGTNDTAGDSTTAMHLDAQAFDSNYVGMTIWNTTQTQSCVITSTTAHELICSGGLSGAVHWDNADAWIVAPGPDQSGSVFYVATASTIYHPSTAGYTACYMAEGHIKLTIDMVSTSMVFTGTLDTAVVTLDAGDAIDSSDTTTDDYICIVNKSTTAAKGLGKRGTWADGGAT